jgi:hypothetical protein
MQNLLYFINLIHPLYIIFLKYNILIYQEYFINISGLLLHMHLK